MINVTWYRLRHRLNWLLALISVLAGGVQAAPAQICPIARSTDIDPRSSLLITETQVVTEAISLERVFDKILRDVGLANTDRLALWQQWWDTQNPSPGLGLGPNCDTSVDANGAPSLNDYPLDCPRNEGSEINHDPFDSSQPGFYYPIALVNRFDLAAEDGAHCGEYRVIFARDPEAGSGRNLLIFEAVLPNPSPACGLDGCREVAEFWARLSGVDDPARRARMLRSFYFRGLRHANVPPVISARHFTAGTGQIRTNQFMSGSQPTEWQLREFKLAMLSSETSNTRHLGFVPVTAKNTPWGPLFPNDADHPQAIPFKRDFLTQIDTLATSHITGIGMGLGDQYHSGQSTVSFFGESDYPQHFDGVGPFATGIQSRLDMLGSTLAPDDIVRRAKTQTCAGCHQLSNNEPLGEGLVWPPSLGFVHVHEQQTELIGGATHFLISDALQNTFLPHRERLFEAFLGSGCRICPPAAALSAGDSWPEVAELSTDSDESLSAQLSRQDTALQPSGSAHTLGGFSRTH